MVYRMNHMTAIILFAVFLLPFSSSAETPHWQQTISRDGIVVYTRKTDYPIDEFKAEAVIDAPVGVILAVIEDAPASSEWMSSISQTRMIRELIPPKLNEQTMTGKSRHLVYSIMDTPWPLTVRDVLLEVTTVVDFRKMSVQIEYHAVESDAVAKNKDWVRMSVLNGSWTLNAIDSAHTKAVYQVKSDPGGIIPAAFANSASRDIPFQTLSALKKMVTRNKYIKAAGKYDFSAKK